MTRLAAFVVLLSCAPANAQKDTAAPGYHPERQVANATRMDWIFPNANQSPARVPDGFLDGNYDSKQQTYELYIPEDYDKKKSWPAVVYVSPSSRGNSFPKFSALCRESKAIFIAPQNVGNNVPMPQRIRIVMDALDDARRILNIDPDRTYITGFSGGGRVACAIAYAVPEYFGGVMPLCAGGQLRQEVWLQQRVIDRLRVALVTGETDFNRGEVERLTFTMLEGQGVSVRKRVVPKLGHGIPGTSTLKEAYQWLEEGVESRRRFAKSHPASSLQDSPDRAEWAKLLLEEARQRMRTKETLYSGLMQMKGIYTRWPDLPHAREALGILRRFENDVESGWEEQDVANQRRTLIARARAVDAYGSGPLPKQYVAQRPAMLRAAVQLWQQVIQDGKDVKAVKEAKTRIPKLLEEVKNSGE